MVSRLLGLALGVVLASQVGAQQADNKKVRELIDLPETFFKFGAGLDAAGTVWIDGDVFDVPGDVAALEKALRGDDSDLERYCKLSLLYTDEAKRKQAAARAVELARGQLRKEPDNPRFAVQMGEALWDSEQEADAEKYFRQAVRLAPADADCLLALGQFLSAQSSYALIAGDRFKDWKGKNVWYALMSGQIPSEKVAPENIARCRELLNEAGDCHDRAVAASPRKAKLHLARAGLHVGVKTLDAFVRPDEDLKQRQYMMFAAMCSAETMSDLARAAELSPGEPRIQLTVAFTLVMSVALHEASLVKKNGPPFPEEVRKKFAPYTERLEKLVNHQDRKIAAEACFGLGLMEFLLVGQGSPGAKKWLRRAVTLQPGHERSWELLCGTAVTEGNEAMAVVSEEWVQSTETARNRYFAARARWLLNQFGKAEEHLRAGLRLDPADLRTLIGLAALLLRRDDDSGFAEADRLLIKVNRLLAAQKDAAWQNEADALRGFHALLSGSKLDDGKTMQQGAVAFFNRAENALRKKEYAQANQYCDLAIRLDPRLGGAFFCRATVWHKAGKYDEALKDYDQATTLDPKNAYAFANRGLIWSCKGDFDRALKDFDEAIRLDPKQAFAFRCRANAWYAKGDYDKTIEGCDEAIRLDPRDSVAFRSRGDAWFCKQQFDQALKDYDAIIRLDPKNGAAFYAKAACLAIQGNTDPAFENLARALELGWKDFQFMASDRSLNSLRNDPRYDDLLKKYVK